MKRSITLLILICSFPLIVFAQQADENPQQKKFKIYEDSLISLGIKLINDENDLERKNANYAFIKTLVSALKMPNSFLYPFDSLKTIHLIQSPDNKFRIFSWHVMNQDGSYRFYGAIQMNAGSNLKLFPLEDFSPFIKHPEDTLTSHKKWYGAQYYKIIPVSEPTPYYILLGWKGNTIKSTKKIIEVLSFKDAQPVLGLALFQDSGKVKKRIVFEYNRQVSMLLKYIPEQKMIIFDHLSPPDPKMKSDPETYGPDLSYDGYQLKNGLWVYVRDLDLRNFPQTQDEIYNDPKKPETIPGPPKK